MFEEVVEELLRFNNILFILSQSIKSNFNYKNMHYIELKLIHRNIFIHANLKHIKNVLKLYNECYGNKDALNTHYIHQRT